MLLDPVLRAHREHDLAAALGRPGRDRRDDAGAQARGSARRAGLGARLAEQLVPHVQIFATDIDGRALAAARVGRYPAAIAADVTPERLARWFIREGDTYCVAKELREMCIFSAHSVIKDAPFSRLDLVSCRNLLIYLNPELQDRVIPLFHFALQPGGFLFLGNAENATRHGKLFEPIDRRARIFRRLDSGARIVPDLPIASPGTRIAEMSCLPRRQSPEGPGLARRPNGSSSAMRPPM